MFTFVLTPICRRKGKTRVANSMEAGQAAQTEVAATTGLAWKQRLIRCGLFALALLPLLWVTQLINRYGVNVPYADEFTLAPLLVKAHQHALTFSDLFAQHNEHRYFFPRLLFIAIAFCAQGNLRAEMFFSVFLTLLTSVNLWILLRKTTSLSRGQQLTVLFVFNLLLFSPVQAENWTWGFQFPLFLCNYLVTCGLLAAFSSLNLSRKFALCTVLAFIATFSFGGGVVLWALTFPWALVAHRELTWKARGLWFGAWCAAAVGSIALYFLHYVKPPYHPPIAASGDPVDYFLYVAVFLGNHLSRASRLEPIHQAAVIGTALLALYFGALLYALRRFRESALVNRMLPWFALGAYSLLSGFLAAAARIGFGVSQALDSRYTSFSLYLSVAGIALFIIAKEDLRRRGLGPRLTTVLVRLETVLLTGFAIFSLIAFSWGRDFMIGSERTRLCGKGALLFTNVIDSGEIHARYLIANAPHARAFANRLDSIGLMHPRMLRSAEIAKLDTRPKQAGFIDGIAPGPKASSVTGWAIIPKTHRPAHCVVLTYQEPGKGEVAFRIASEIHDRPDVAAALHTKEATASGWTCHFDRSRLPPGEILLSAWAFDANRGILYPLGNPRILY